MGTKPPISLNEESPNKRIAPHSGLSSQSESGNEVPVTAHVFAIEILKQSSPSPYEH